jgi:hypothetical protein
MRIVVAGTMYVNLNLRRKSMATIQRKNVKQETLTTQELKDLIRIANEGYSATWLCDFAEILTQAGELSLEIGRFPTT